MHRFWVVTGLLFVSFIGYSQSSNYWIRFTDKNNNAYSISNPEEYLSQRSVSRRTSHNVLIDETDLPMTTSYISSVLPFTNRLIHRLKWTNMLVVYIDNAASLDSILQFSFVDTVGRIEENPNRQWQEQDKFESVEIAVNQQYVADNPYGIAYRQANMLNIDLVHQLGFRGQNILVSSFDNGFVNVNAISAFDSVRPRILNTYDFVNHETDVYNEGAHGTNTFSNMAANITNRYLGTAPDAQYLLLQTEDNSREWVMEEYNWQAAAEYADSIGAQIFTTSLGYTTFDSSQGSHAYNDLNGNSTVITRAANLAAGKGILVLNSAGNEGDKSWHYISAPADGDSVIAVGAVDSSEKVTGFSGRGPNSLGRIKPDICAQGQKSAVISVQGDLGYSAGTSFSCPIMAGAFASLWSAFPNLSARDIYTAIVVSADNFWTPDNFHGYGIPNFYNAYLFLKTDYNQQILRMNDNALVYPNPFTTELNLSIYSPEYTSYSIEIFDLQGRRVHSSEQFLRDSTFEILTLSEAQKLVPGEYVLRFRSQGKTFVHRLLKTGK